MLEGLRFLQHRRIWNWAALVLILLSALLVVKTIASMDTLVSPKQDHLSLTAAPNTLHERKNVISKRLQRAVQPDSKQLEADREKLKTTPYKVSVGLYAMNNYALNLKVPSFQGSGYAWFKWDQATQDYFKERNIDVWKVIAPVNLLSVPNGISSVFQPIGEADPLRMPDGTYYQIVSYKGEFFIDRGDFTQHPFPHVSLPIILEADDINLDFRALRILPDISGSGTGEFIASNSSWVPDGWSIAEYRHRYDTTFGFGDEAADYSQLIFDVNYRTSGWTSFWKLLAPMLIVMGMIIVSTKIEPSLWELRMTLPVTVLLTLVFLQQGINAELPDLPYLTFIDEVFVVAYLLTLISFCLMLWGSRRYFKAVQMESESEKKEALRTIELTDDTWPAAAIFIGMVAIAVCWLTV